MKESLFNSFICYGVLCFYLKNTCFINVGILYINYLTASLTDSELPKIIQLETWQ